MKRFIVIAASFFIFVQSACASSAANMAKLEKLFLDGRYATVISEAETIINSGGGKMDDVYYIKGLSELKSNKFKNARDSFNYIIDKCPRSDKLFDARLGVGDSYIMEGNNSRALSIYSEMVGQYSADKNIPVVYGRLSMCYSKMGLHDKADSYLKMVKDAAPYSFEAKSGSTAAPSVKKNISSKMPAPDAGDGKYSVQVGSFKNKRNAEVFAEKLKAKGYKSYISIPVLSTDKFYRVKVGNFSSQAEASNISSKLKSEGYRTRSCTDDVCE